MILSKGWAYQENDCEIGLVDALSLEATERLQVKKQKPYLADLMYMVALFEYLVKELICEPIGIYGRKESEEGFHFFKALGDILKNKLKGRSWDDFCVVNICKIKRQVDAQLS